MPVLYNKTTKRNELVPNEMLDAARESGDYDIAADAAQTVTLPSGRVVEAAPGDAAAVAATLGARPATEAERAATEQRAYVDQEYGGAGGKAIAGIGTALDSALLGAPGAVLRAVAPEASEEFRRYQEASPRLTTAANVGGAIASSIIPGAPLARLGATATKAAGGKAVGKIVGLAAEGGGGGFGQGVQELTQSAKPIDFERAVSVLGTNTLMGTAGGLVLGVGGHYAKSAAKGIVVRGRAALDDIAKARTAGASAATDDVAGAAKAYRAEFETKKPLLAVNEGESATDFIATNKAIKRALKDPVGLQENPGKLIPTVRTQIRALDDAIADSGNIAAKQATRDAGMAKGLAEELATLPDASDTVRLEGKLATRYAAYTPGVRASAKEGIAIPRAAAEDFLGALQRGEVQGASAAALKELPALKASAEGFLATLETAAASGGKGGGLVGGFLEKEGTKFLASSLVGLAGGGPIGALAGYMAPKAAAKIVDLVSGRLAKAGAEQSLRTTAALDAFLSAGTKAGRATPVLATKVLGEVSFGAPPKTGGPVYATGGTGKPLIDNYRAREAELRAQVTPGPDGKPVMLPAARRKVAERLQAVAAVNPQMADGMETVIARRVEFLASKLPRRPDIGAMQIGPDRWQPSSMAIRAFARYVAAVEDPGAVEERLVHGTVTPEDAEAYQAVYPERFVDFKRQLLERLPEVRESLPYQRKVALSIFTGVPVDPAMHPQILRVLQGNFPAEAGTEGGTQAPQAQPAFGAMGSMSKPEPTSAQERAG